MEFKNIVFGCLMLFFGFIMINTVSADTLSDAIGESPSVSRAYMTAYYYPSYGYYGTYYPAYGYTYGGYYYDGYYNMLDYGTGLAYSPYYGSGISYTNGYYNGYYVGYNNGFYDGYYTGVDTYYPTNSTLIGVSYRNPGSISVYYKG